jgi:glycosyltransferase involved in cell wall biosynthesis
MSPVGVNSDIINDGVNGYLANNNKEWVEKISALIDSAELRKEIGKNGRKTIEESYSINSLSPKYLNYFNDIID